MGAGTSSGKTGATSVASSSAGGVIEKTMNSLPVLNGISKVKTEDSSSYRNEIKKLPVGSVVEFPSDTGTDRFTLTQKGEYVSFWEHDRGILNPNTITDLAVSRWLAGRGNIARGKIRVIIP